MVKFAKIAIMQPTFLPWVGYFKMIKAVDAFIFLDDVQFERRSWQSRNKILRQDGSVGILSLSLAKHKRSSLINELFLATGDEWKIKLLNQLASSYQKSPFYKNLEVLLKERLYTHTKLCELNISLIKAFMDILAIKTPLFTASKLLKKRFAKEEHLLELCLHLNANCYLAASGSKGYLEQNEYKFLDKGVKVQYFSFTPPSYPQLQSKSFISHLSVIDLLLCPKTTHF